MPNTGRPSRDCHLCRQRRVKCDLTRPACRRCTNAGRECPGYRNELDLLFQQTESVSSYPTSSARDRRFRRPIEQVGTGESVQDLPELPPQRLLIEQTPAHQFAAPVSRLPVLPRNLAQSWDEHVIPLVINQLTPSPAPRRLLGVVDFFPNIAESREPDEVLMLSSKAFLFAYLSNKYGDTDLQSKKISAYGRALAATSNALGDPKLCRQDNVVFSCFLLGMYGLVNGSHATQDQPGPPDWTKHTNGLLGLFRARGTEQFSTQRGCDIFRLLNESMQAHYLATGKPCPPETLDWLHAIEAYVPSAELDVHQRAIQAYHAAAICARIKQALDKKDRLPVNSTFDEIDKIDAALEAIMTRKSFAETMRIGMGYNRNYGNTVRIKMQRSILQLTSSQHVQESVDLVNVDDLHQRQSRSVALIQALADEILCTIPYLLGDDPRKSPSSRVEPLGEIPRPWVDCVRLIWPLRTIASGAYVRQDQVKIATAALSRISSEFYVRFALEPLWVSVEQLRHQQTYEFEQRRADTSSSGTQAR